MSLAPEGQNNALLINQQTILQVNLNLLQTLIERYPPEIQIIISFSNLQISPSSNQPYCSNNFKLIPKLVNDVLNVCDV